jgi:serine/threonine protein kinase/tetratricopeptide (TPR) repeat protein
MECPQCHRDNTSDSRYCRYCASPLIPPAGAGETVAAREPGLDLRPGDEVAGKYRITRKLGGGGMGVVYEAEDTRLRRRVALKFLISEQTLAPEAKERFVREAQASSKLDHPNICTVYEIGEDEARRLFIAMAFCPRESLKEKLKGGPLPFREAVEIAVQIARGLACAHEQGIIHRDIKPGNIMEAAAGEYKIVDFGLAKVIEDSAITRTAGMTGTLAYMSPEQVQGERLGFPTDIWSLGVMLYEMLTGVLPFGGEHTQAVIFAILNISPVPPSEVRAELPAALDRIVLRCLAKDPRYRYPNVASLLADLGQIKKALDSEAPTSAAPRSLPLPKRETEQRQATVLFAEIAALAEILATAEGSQAASVLRRSRACFDFIEDAYGGRVDRVADSTFRAIFGFPDAIEDVPAKAVQAALSLRERFAELSRAEGLEPALQPAIGICSGSVIIGEVGTDDSPDLTIVGDPVTAAAAFKDLAGCGTILVGPGVVAKTQDTFAYRTLKPVALKGREKPVPVFELLAARERTVRRRLGNERVISSSLVGRTKELDKLQLHVLKAVNGQGSIVNLIGEAGVGKSALLAELKTAPVMGKVKIIEGSALAIGKNLSFHPLIDALRNWAGIGEDDGPAESLGKLERAVRWLGPEDPEEIFPFVATLMGFRVAGQPAERLKGIEGEALEKLVLKSLRDLLERASHQKPLVVILEDLHWADSTSIRFLESLYRLAESHPILFLNVFRPDYEDTSQRLLQTIHARYGRAHLDIPLEPLDEADAGILIANLLKLSAPPVVARELIVRRTEGNPLFIEEVLRSFIDDGVIEVRDGAFHVTDRINAVVIPETIRELLTARIDKLDEDAKSLLKIAAVIGRSFLYRVLVDVAVGTPGIDPRLEVLRDSQLIRQGRAGEEIEWQFKHALVQEVAYESILPRKRKELHLRIARAIESLYAGRISEFYGMLAFHFSKAEDLEKAEDYLIRAGQEALKSSASDEALHYYEEALKIYLAKSGAAADPDKLAMLRKNIGIALFDRGRLFEAIDHFEQAMTLYGVKEPRGPVAKAARFVGGFLNFVIALYWPGVRFRRVPSDRDQAVIDLYKRKMTALSVTIPLRMFFESFYFSRLLVSYDMTKVENGLGILAGYAAIFAWPGMSFTLSRKVLQVVEPRLRPDHLKPWIYFRFSEIIHHFFTGGWDRIPPCDDELVVRSLKIGEFFYTTTYLDMLCHFNIERGRLDLAGKYLQMIHDIHTAYEYDYAKDEYYFLKTLMLTKTRQTEEALRTADEGLAFAKPRGLTPDVFSMLAFKAKAQIRLDDLAGAEKSLEELDQILSKENEVPLNRSWRLKSQFMLGLRRLGGRSATAAAGGGAKEVRQLRRLGRRMARNSRKVAPERTEVYRLLGILDWTRGRRGRALRWWTKSLAEGRRLGASLELAWTYREAGLSLKEEEEKAGRRLEIERQGAIDLLAEADALFAGMDLPRRPG